MDVTIRSLHRFLECPVQGWARDVLGLPAGEDEDLVERDLEPLRVDSLGAASLLRSIVIEEATGAAPPGAARQALMDQLQALEEIGRAPTGPLRGVAQEILEGVRQQWTGCLEDVRGEELQTMRFGPGVPGVRGILGLPPLELGTEGPRLRLVGTTGLCCPARNRGYHFVTREDVKPRDFLPGFIDGMVLRAAGRTESGPFSVTVVPAEGEAACHEFPIPDRPEALAFLRGLAGALRRGSHHRLLFLEAVEEAGEDRAAGIEVAVREAVRNLRVSCSCDHGPVEDARTLRPVDREVYRSDYAEWYEAFFAEGIPGKGGKGKA